MRLNVLSIIALLISTPSWADALDDYLDSLPPLPKEVRQSFTKAMMASYDPECRCSLFIDEAGRIEELKIPLSDTSMRLVIESLKRGLITPLVRDGST